MIKVWVNPSEAKQLIIRWNDVGEFRNFEHPITHVRPQIVGNELQIHLCFRVGTVDCQSIKIPVDDIGIGAAVV